MRTLALVMLVALSTGCTSIRYTTPDGGAVSVDRFMAKANIKSMYIIVEKTDGMKKTVIIDGYGSKTDGEAVKSASKGIVSGIISFIKGGL